MADTTLGFQFDSCAPRASRSEGEAALVEGLRSGLEDAYETLIGRFEHPVFSLVSRLMDDPGDAADVVQEVFLKVFRNIGSFRGDSALKTWIYRIAVNEARNHRRWFSRHRRQEVGLEPDAGAAQPPLASAAKDRSWATRCSMPGWPARWAWLARSMTARPPSPKR